MKKTGSTNKHLVSLIQDLKEYAGKENSAFWKRIVKDLEKPSRNRRKVNLVKINDCSKDGEVVIIPGKVLGVGSLDHKVTVVAFQFSESASEKLKDKLTIRELFEKNPKIKDARILG
jgi:large subunit ribosomal protein L18e